MIKKSTSALLFLLFITCKVHAQTEQPESLKHYLSLTNSFLQDGGKWIRQNKDMIPGEINSASYYALEFYRGINTNTVQLRLKNYLPLSSEWKIIGELILSWNAKKQKVVLYGVGSDGVIITGESQLTAVNELQLVSSSTNAEGKTEVSKEVFRFKDGKIEVSDTGDKGTIMTFIRMEQPTGNIIFMSTRDGNFEIYSMDIKGENLKNLSCNKAMDYAFSYTPDKRLVFYTNRDGNDDIYVMEADGKKVTNLTNHPAADRIPCVSPDGKQVLFLSDREDKNGKIYSMDIDGTHLKKLTNNSYFEDAPTWSYDGKKIVFSRELRDLKDTSRNEAVNGEIFIMDADGKNEMQLTDRPGFDGGAQISPDGKRIVFYGKSEKAKYDIFLMDIDGKNLMNLTEDDMEDYSPSWSPDGKWVACTRGDSKNYDVWLINLETKIKTRLTTQPKRDESPFWQK
ncbi:MAG: hypothetical protein WAT20_04165 [Ferruginibacter sp.]|nr:PD40 domain-containing protein [Chitinophagaceae bacterium]